MGMPRKLKFCPLTEKKPEIFGLYTVMLKRPKTDHYIILSAFYILPDPAYRRLVPDQPTWCQRRSGRFVPLEVTYPDLDVVAWAEYEIKDEEDE